ncbi:BON domain-containing protein [Duganella sp. BuS-21]|uniref:BON domain-containing protein n=1 Tax=Duganella sp. BuS-21 TaxID=2943848 RepID=UPI0035A734CA
MKTDHQIQQDVLAELEWEPAVNAAGIGVEVDDGIVTLAGHVESYAEKWDAERAAQRVGGVRALAIEMDVRLPGSSKRDDVDIARTVENSLQWSISVPKDSVHVLVEKGYVTLTGQVSWTYQRDAAILAVRYLMGVTGVSNQILIKQTVSPVAVQAQIEASLKRQAHQDARKIAVSVHGADVTLTGVVPSWTERDLARNAAWSAAGVHNVIDELTVV